MPIDHHIGRFEVAVNDALIVDGLEAVHELESDVVPLAKADAPGRADHLAKLDPIDELHRDEPDGFRRAVIMDATNVLVGHAAGELDFGEQPLRHRRVIEKLLPQDLDRNRFIQCSIKGLVDDPHSALADVREYFVAIGEEGTGYDCDGAAGRSVGCPRRMVVSHCSPR